MSLSISCTLTLSTSLISWPLRKIPENVESAIRFFTFSIRRGVPDSWHSSFVSGIRPSPLQLTPARGWSCIEAEMEVNQCELGTFLPLSIIGKPVVVSVLLHTIRSERPWRLPFSFRLKWTHPFSPTKQWRISLGEFIEKPIGAMVIG